MIRLSMKMGFRYVVFAVCLLICFCDETRGQVPNDIKQVVGFIFGKVHLKDSAGVTHKVEMPLGTGFFVVVLDRRGGPDWGYFYFVTAKHVLRDSDNRFLPSVRVRLNLQSTTGDKNFDYEEIPVSDNLGNLTWLQDPDDPQDEAVAFPIVPNNKKFMYKTIPTDDFVTDQLLKEQNVSEGDPVMLVGLMAQFYGSKRNFPVVRKGSIALLSDEPLPAQDGSFHKGYVCEVGTWPGNSGSPVFLYLGGFRGNTIGDSIGGIGYRLLGIMIAFYTDSRSGEITDTATVSVHDPSNIGLAFVLPAQQITKVLSQPRAQASRDEQTAEHNKAKQ
jgi:hypothetical protein